MTMRSTFALPWPPSVNHYWRHVPIPLKGKPGKFRVQTLISKEGRDYRKRVFELCSDCMPTITGRLRVLITAYPPDRRARDLDNLPKAVLDALEEAGAYENDSHIDDLRIVRGEIQRGGGAITVVVEQIDGEETQSETAPLLG